jgi:hypothetical protein
MWWMVIPVGRRSCSFGSVGAKLWSIGLVGSGVNDVQ